MNQVYQNNGAKRTNLENDIGTSITDRMAGNNPALSSMFASDNQAQTAQANQRMQDANDSSMFGSGAASRNNQAVSNQNMQNLGQSAQNQQTEMAKSQQAATGEGESWNQQMTNKDQQNYQNAYEAAKDTGNTVAMSGLGGFATDQTGNTLTNYGQAQMTQQANEQKANAAEEKNYQDQIKQLQLKQLRKSVKGGSSSLFGDFTNYLGQGTKAIQSGASLAALFA